MKIILNILAFCVVLPAAACLLLVYAMRCRVNRVVLEKARNRKSKKAQRLASLRQARAERRLFQTHHNGEEFE